MIINKAKLIQWLPFFFGVIVIATISAVLTLIFVPKEYSRDQQILLANKEPTRIIFHDLSSQDLKKVEDLTREQLRLIVSKPQFLPSVGVVEKHKEKIKQEADNAKIPESIALGVALLENGGSETEISTAGAAGIFQLTKGTAKNLGLAVDDQSDERLNPDKNIEAGLRYLDQNLALFSDIGLAVWAHHAGPNNVSKAVKIYLKNLGEEDAFEFVEAEKLGKLDRAKYVWRAYVTKDGMDVHKVLDNFTVRVTFLSTLDDESALYTYKVAAAAVLFETWQNYSDKAKFEEKVAAFKQGRILLADLLEVN